MTNNPEIRSLMTPIPHTVEASEPLRIARQIMRDHGIRHLPVVAGKRFVGVISDRDLKWSVVIEKNLPEGLTVADVCVSDAYTVAPTATLGEVSLAMSEKGIGSAVILDHGDVVGIFTATDACRILSQNISSGTK